MPRRSGRSRSSRSAVSSSTPPATARPGATRRWACCGPGSTTERPRERRSDRVNPELFLADLEAKPAYLAALAEALAAGDPWAGLPPYRRVLLLGMGSSRYAARV